MTARENLTTQNFVFIELLYMRYLSRVSKMAVEFEVPSRIRGSEATMSVMKYRVQIQAESIGRETSPH